MQMTEPKTWKERKCARSGTPFIPTAGQQKICLTCDQCIAAAKGGAKAKRRSAPPPKAIANGNGKGKPVQTIAVTTPTIDGLAGATALLEMAGYRVREVRTPAGIMLLVAGAA